MQIEKNYIAGAWVDSASDATVDVINPATAEPIAKVPEGSPADVDRAAEAAVRAQASFAQTSPAEREALLADAEKLEILFKEMLQICLWGNATVCL